MLEGLALDDLDPIVRLATIALVGVVGVGLARRVFGWEGARTDGWTCPHCAKRSVGPSRFCYSCSNYATVLDDPGSTQLVLFVGWFPAVMAAAIGGTVVALATWDPWPFLVVLVAGSLLGWVGTLVFFFGAAETWWRHRRDEGAADRIFVTTIGMGPGIAAVTTTVVALIWP